MLEASCVCLEAMEFYVCSVVGSRAMHLDILGIGVSVIDRHFQAG